MTRPTAVNLFFALDAMQAVVDAEHATVGERVDVGGLHDRVAGEAQMVGPQLVADYEQDVRPLRWGRRLRLVSRHGGRCLARSGW